MINRPRGTHPEIVYPLLILLVVLVMSSAAASIQSGSIHRACGVPLSAETARRISTTEQKRSTSKGQMLADPLNSQLAGPYQWAAVPILHDRWLHRSELFIKFFVSDTNSTTWILLAIIIGALFVFSIAGLVSFIYLTRRTNASIRKLGLVVNRLSKGSLDSRAETNNADAVGSLGSAVNRLAASMQARAASEEKRARADNQAAEDQIRRLQAALSITARLHAPTHAPALLAETLENAAKLVCERLQYRLVGIYLLEETQETAQLHAAAGETADLHLQAPGVLVNSVIASGEIQIRRQLDHDPAIQPQPIPTSSEMALPLTIGQDMLGVIDLYSDRPGAFLEAETHILQTIAGQIAAAIQDVRRVTQLEQSVQELQTGYRQFTQDEWLEFLQNKKEPYALRLRDSRMEANPPMSPESIQSLAENKTVLNAMYSRVDQNASLASSLAVPIQVRGQTIGTLNIQFKTGKVTSETMQLVENIVDRLAGALENARLLEVIEKRAERERRLAEITSRVRSSASIDQILQTALMEISRGLGVSNAAIQLGDPTENEVEGKW